mgnify:CR=1 FL=1
MRKRQSRAEGWVSVRRSNQYTLSLLDKKLADGKSTNPGSDRKHLNKLSSLVVLHEKVDACYKVPLP